MVENSNNQIILLRTSTPWLQRCELTDEQIFWAGLKHFYSHVRSGFTIIYDENYAFFSVFTKALPTDGRTDGWMDGWTDGRMDD